MKKHIRLISVAFIFFSPYAACVNLYVPKMQFETCSGNWQITMTYLDPTTLGLYLNEPRVIPFKLILKNKTGKDLLFNKTDMRLDVSDTLLYPADISSVIEEMERLQVIPKVFTIFKFIGEQSSTFHPNKFEHNINKIEHKLKQHQLQNRVIKSGKTAKGFLYYVIPEEVEPTDWCTIYFMEEPPQVIRTTNVEVKNSGGKNNFVDKFNKIWKKYVSGKVQPFDKSYALLIGIGKYQHLKPLSSPVQDVSKISDYLQSQGFNEWIELDEMVSIKLLKEPEEYFNTKVNANDRFLFYYSGHGRTKVSDKGIQGFIPLHSEKEGRYENSIAMDSLVNWMVDLEAKHLLVILDCCFSGLALGIETKSDNKWESIQLNADRLYSYTRYNSKFLIMAGMQDQESFAGKDWNGSMFTEILIKGLNHDADMNDDQIITIHELYAWLRPSVEQEAERVERKLTPLMKDLENVSIGEFLFVR